MPEQPSNARAEPQTGQERHAGGVPLRLAATAWLATSAALATWPADVVVLSSREGLADRIASLPGAGRAWTALGLASLAVGAIVATSRRRERAAVRGRAALLVLSGLAALAIPFLPLAGDVLPFVSVLAGPLRWAVVAALAWAGVWLAFSNRIHATLGRWACG
jgi:hypothetical protein